MDLPTRDPRDDDERARLVGRLAGGIGHDLNNLFTAAYAALDALSRAEPAERPAQEWLLRQCVDRGAGLGRWLVAFGRLRGGPPDVVDPVVLLTTAERLLARCLAEGVALRLDLRRDAGLVLADEGLVERLLAVLLLAGAEACADPSGASEVCLSCRSAGPSWLQLSVALDGQSVPTPAELPALLERLGGRLQPADATRLAVALPTVEESWDEAAVEPSAVRGASILLCESDDLVREALCAQLEAQGHTVRGAASVSEALDARHPTPDLLVTELHLPDGEGPSLARQLAARRADLAVLFIASPRDVSGALTTEPAVEGALLIKPFRQTTLVQALARLLG